MNRILFVCMGNICRSPTAQGVFQQYVEKTEQSSLFELDSAGTGDWHVGLPPDTRAQQAALQRGIDLSELRARQVESSDFDYFDLIIAMDNNNRSHLLEIAGSERRHKVKLMLDFSELAPGKEVPDPYYGGDQGFDLVLDLIEEACQNLLHSMTKQSD